MAGTAGGGGCGWDMGRPAVYALLRPEEQDEHSASRVPAQDALPADGVLLSVPV